jgi:succinoglycan biosynthesis transport protein ExoP
MSEFNAITQRDSRGEVGQRLAQPPASADFDHDEGPDWTRVIAAIRRHATLVIAIIGVGIAGSVYAAKQLHPVYRATTTLWIASQTENQGRAAQQLGPIRQDQLLQWESWNDLLRSYAILDPVAHRLRLNVEPADARDSTLFRTFESDSALRGDYYSLKIADDGAFTLLRGRSIVDHGTMGDSIGEKAGFRWAPPRDPARFGRTVKFEVLTPRTASERLARSLESRVDRNGAFIRVDLSGQNPVRTAEILNAIASRYVEVASDLKRRRLTEFARNLEQQRTESQMNLERAERELGQFRVKSVGLPRVDEATRGALPAADPLLSDGAELDRVRRDRSAISAWLATEPAARSPSGPLITDEGAGPELKTALEELARKRADLRALRYRYEDSFGAVQHLTEDIKTLSEQTIPGIVRQLDADLAFRERAASGRVASRAQELRAVPPRMLEEARLTRAATEAAELNATVQQRYQEARLAQSSSLPDIAVLDQAMPPQLPASDQSRRILLLGVAASIALALGLAVMIDRVDPRVRYPAEVSRQMGLNILGAVPFLSARRENGAITPAAAEEVTESLRGVRLALTHSGNVKRPLLFTISSSGPGDGKSFITSNLGLSFALAGYRTLMIDGDIRRGTLHRAFGVERKPGLTECLRGDIQARDAVQATTFASLGIIGSGTRTRLAPELLGGPRMKSLIETLSSDFDVIICDSPPLSAGVDPYLLASVTGQMLIVLRTGVSVRSVLAAKLAVLGQLPVTLLGAVLNAVPNGELYRPYSYYVEGYEAVDEPEVTTTLPSA